MGYDLTRLRTCVPLARTVQIKTSIKAPIKVKLRNKGTRGNSFRIFKGNYL
jgi:hypothetical protein